MAIVSLEEFLESKGNEYAPFDPNRAKIIYQRLSKYLKNPSKKIHIVGTNGKGSTGRFITLGLLQAGYSALHFTSPHLFDFNERYYKNGHIVDDKTLQEAHYFLQQFDFIQACSYFEYATFLALVLAQDVTFLVLEAGLGGEWDSTSCLKRDISVFTPIGLDHQEILGESVEKIATTKLNSMSSVAFIAPQSSCVIKDIAQSIALKHKTKLYFVPNTIPETIFSYAKTHHLPEFLMYNLHTALYVLSYLQCTIDLIHFPMLDLTGRCQKITPHITIDVGHNEQAAKEIAKVFNHKKVILVYNTYKQKDVYTILKLLKPVIKKILIIEISNPRIIEKPKLQEVIQSLEIPSGIFSLEAMQKNEEYLVFGSFSVVKQFLEEYRAR
ncbi:Mur ligase family protein [Helicobacter sp. 11S03491-1]|uniref:Mur ligase family protein n=1 Tax=Helicobacter sp. 11S03491-1 TaxID=1476196 RepID=UPI000BA78158|nr:Mur ligase family protein [Helicobacter sp. 11S03491-1]PAF42031.1 hypothetical protein BKH45_05475 [Helicobacter sp. 11S03491-1]